MTQELSRDVLQAGLDAAIREAEQGWLEGGIPIGSALLDATGRVVAAGHNLRVQSGDPTAHAEVSCIRSAGRRRDWRQLTLVSTLSPCPMCSGTAILFLLKAGERSHWHRVDADEIWLWHAGAPLTLWIGEAAFRTTLLGPDVLNGQAVQALVPAGHWQAAESTGAFTLVSCTVSPGFRFEGFELAPEGFTLPPA